MISGAIAPLAPMVPTPMYRTDKRGQLKVHFVRVTGKWPGHPDLRAAIPDSGRVTGRRDISMNSESPVNEIAAQVKVHRAS